MTLSEAEIEGFCLSLPGANMAVQWRGERVFKVGAKMFAVLGSDRRLSFKCSDVGFQLLIERDGVMPAPYLTRAHWVTLTRPDALERDDVLDHLRLAYGLVLRTLARAERERLTDELRARPGRSISGLSH